MEREPASRLYWSIRGHVACDHHAPNRQSAQWTAECWEIIPDTAAFDRQGQPRYQCQSCAQSGLAIVHWVRLFCVR